MGQKNGQSREEHKLGVAKEQKEHIEADAETELGKDTLRKGDGSGLEFSQVHY